MSSPRKTFFQLDHDSDMELSSGDDEGTVAPRTESSDLTVATCCTSGDTTLVNPDTAQRADKDDDEESNDESPYVAAVTQRAVLHQLETGGKRQAPVLANHGESDDDDDADLHPGEAGYWEFMLPMQGGPLVPESRQNDKFGGTPAPPDAVSTPKRKHSPAPVANPHFAELPTNKKIKYSESFLRHIQPTGTSSPGELRDERAVPAAVTHPSEQNGSGVPASVRESSCLADSSGSPVLVQGGGQDGSSTLVFVSKLSAPLPSHPGGESQPSPVKLSQSQPMPTGRPTTPPSRTRRFSPPRSRGSRCPPPLPPTTVAIGTHIQQEAARVYLGNLGLTYQESLRGVVCSCGIWLSSTNIQGHLKQAHHREKVDGEYIQDALKVLGGKRGTPRIPLNQDFIPGLILYNCYQCGVDGCPVVMKSEARMREHSAMCHKIPKEKRVPWERCPAQRLNRTDRKSFFRVNIPEREKRPTVNSCVRDIFAEVNRKRGQGTSRLGGSDHRHTTSWVIANKWPEIIGDRTPQSIRALVDNEGEIKHLSTDLWAAMKHCSSLISYTPRVVLQKLYTSDPASGRNDAPFYHHQYHESTMKSYAAPALHLLALLLRTIDQQEEELRELLVEYQMMSDSIPDGESREAATHAICCILYYCWTREWLPTEDNLQPDPTMRSLAYSTDTTGDSAKISYLIRFIMLWAMHYMGDDTVSEACDRLATWFTEKRESTFNSVQRLKHYASSRAHGTILPPMLFWLDPESEKRMSYHGDVIELDDVVSMFAALGEDLVSLWDKEVSLGLDDQLVIKPMAHVADDLSNESVGYSFLTDERNTYHLEKATVLSIVLQNRELTGRFSNGYDYVTGRPMWNPLGIRVYLKHVQAFSRLLLARIEMTSGAPIRGTELTAMMFLNTLTQRRNLIMFGKFLVLLGLYSDTTSLTRADGLIAHGVDALTAGLLIHFLTFIRPFVQVLVSECFCGDEFPGLHDMYDNLLFVDYDKLFTTERLSNIIEQYTDRFLSFPLSISHWRHVSIGFHQAHCRSELLAVTDVSSAEQAGPSLALENHICSISADGIERTPVGDMRLFCEVSVAYQIVMRVVPSGIQLPYRRCMPKDFEGLVNQGLIVLPRDRTKGPEDIIADKVIDELKLFLNKLVDAREGKAREQGKQQSIIDLPTPLVQPTRKASHQQDDTLEYVDSPMSTSVPCAQTTGTPHQEEDELEYVDNPMSLSPSVDKPESVLDEDEEEPLEFGNDPPWSDVLDYFDNETVGPAQLHTSVKGKGKVSLTSDYLEPVNVFHDMEETPSEWAARYVPSFEASNSWFGTPPVKVNMPSKYDTSEALVVLRQLLHDVEAEWTSNLQSWSIAHVMEGQHDVLVVGPAGCGKTFVALIPAILEREMKKITIIVVPLVSLLDDYQRRLKEFGIPYHVYTTNRTPVEGIAPDVRIILTTINRVATATFQRTMKSVHLKTPIARIVVDEVHYALTGSYRPEFDDVERVRFMEVPLVLMSATVPPHLEKTLVDKYQLTDPHVVVRSSTDRWQVGYGVLEPSKTEEDLCNRAVNIVMDTLATLRSRDRILVFVSTKKIGDMLALALFCEFYYAGDKSTGEPGLTPADRSLILESWHRGDRQVLVSTSALGAGNDYPSTRLVLHVGTPSGMIDFIQESGRAGRDQLPAQSIVIPFQSIYWMLRKDPEDLSGIRAMMGYVEGHHCRRFMLNKFNDAEDRSCTELPDAQLCDYCSMESGILPPHKIQDASYSIPFDPPSSPSGSAAPPGTGHSASNVAPVAAGPSGTISAAPAKGISDMYLKATRQRTSSSTSYVSRIQDAVNVMQRCCLFCSTTTRSMPYHDVNRCPQMMKKADDWRFSTRNEHYMTTWRKNLIYEPRKFGQKPICYKCHLPNGPGDALHHRGGKDTVCAHPDIVSVVGYLVISKESLFQEARAHFGQAWNSRTDYLLWVRQPSVDFPSNLLAVFVWVFAQYFNRSHV